MWTKTETLRRLRKAARMARRAEGCASNIRAEVGTRVKPVAITGRVPVRAEAFDPDDDLDSYWGLSDSVRFMPDQARQPGYIAHIYLSAPYDMLNVITVWLGDAMHEPQLLHVPGDRPGVVDAINEEARAQ